MLLNLGSDRLAASWERFRNGRRHWQRELSAAILEDLPDLGFSRDELTSWLQMDPVLDDLIVGTQPRLDAAAFELVHLVSGSPVLTPDDARTHAERAVVAAHAFVLSCAPDDTTRALGEVIRIAQSSAWRLTSLESKLDSLLAGQALQDIDLVEVATFARSQVHAKTQPPSVLIADDEPAMVSGLLRRLEDQGLVVTQAHTTADALASLAEHDYAVVVVDALMPLVGVMDIVESDEDAAMIVEAKKRETGGQEILARLPAVSPKTRAIVWSVLERASWAPDEVDWYRKSADHRPLLAAVLASVR